MNQSKAKKMTKETTNTAFIPNMYVRHYISLNAFGNSQSYDSAIICIQKPSLLESLLLPEAFFRKFSTFPKFQISLGLHCSLDIISTE